MEGPLSLRNFEAYPAPQRSGGLRDLCTTIASNDSGQNQKNSLERWTLFTAKSQKFPGRISAQREKYALQRCDPDQKIFDD